MKKIFYFKFKEAQYLRSKELIEGQVIADYDKAGNLCGIEILDYENYTETDTEKHEATYH